MAQLYRFCISHWSVGLLNDYFVTNQVPHDRGPFGPMRDSLLSTLIDGSFNYSMIQGGICQHSLHDNKSDIMLYLADMPINDDLIDIYGVIGQSKLQFQSSYRYINKSKNSDVLNSVMSFQPSLWILILLLIFFLALLLKSKQSRTCPQFLSGYMDRLHRSSCISFSRISLMTME